MALSEKAKRINEIPIETTKLQIEYKKCLRYGRETEAEAYRIRIANLRAEFRDLIRSIGE